MITIELSEPQAWVIIFFIFAYFAIKLISKNIK